MTEQAPLVSTIMPVYNREAYLADAIESVINQTYRNIELIVVDDGSTDNSRSVAERFAPPVRYHHQPNAGIAAAWNQGIRLAKGDFFAFLDADDLWTKNKIQQQMDVISENTKFDIVFGHVKQFYSPELSEEERQKIWCPDDMMPGFSAITMLIRRESFFRVGLFDTQWRKGIFNDWYLRAGECGLVSHMLPHLFAQRRLHQANHGIVNRDKSIDYVRMFRASLARRRGHAPD
ncbi:MAG: glycosyltransferase family 2 protein [Nitrospirota bacterium]|nr:glycosyltransferase family 2 protein [Nitrospirota bacterium]